MGSTAATAIGEKHIVIVDRLRELHDDIVFRYFPDIREHTPFMISAIFLIVLATMLGTTYFGGSATVAKPQIRARIEYPVLGAKLRPSRIANRPARTAGALHAPAADANDPWTPMLIDIDPESGALHASAGSINFLGTPTNIGNRPLD